MIEGIKTKQDLFNFVATHLIKQNRQSRASNTGTCAYRGKDGTKCAAGCLLEDEWYKPEFEGRSVFAVEVLPMFEKSIGRTIEGSEYLPPNRPVDSRITDVPDESEIRMLQRLQGIHDGYSPMEWPELLRTLACEYKLELPDCLKEIA